MKQTFPGSDAKTWFERGLAGNDTIEARLGVRLNHKLRFEVKQAGSGSERSTGENPIETTVILVPVDFTPASSAAAELGVNLARQAGGKLVLVHAIHLNLDPIGPAPVARIKEELCQDASVNFQPMLARARDNGVPVSCIVEEGEPASIIARTARRWKTDLIVLTARKRGLLARWLWRGTAERVIQDVDCPVFVLQAGKEGAYV